MLVIRLKSIPEDKYLGIIDEGWASPVDGCPQCFKYNYELDLKF